MFVKGLFIGLVNLLLWPIWLTTVVFCAVTKRPMPKWVLTPDDTVSPYGRYEETVRNVYRRFGKVIGDIYWLGFRNVGYGFLYRFKPQKYKDTTDYSQFERSVIREGRVTTYVVDGLVQKDFEFGFLVFRAGWKVDRVVLDPHTQRQPINMEFRPTFTARTHKTA